MTTEAALEAREFLDGALDAFEAHGPSPFALRKGLPWIDVRSEGEFAQGALPGFVNHPILNDLERHQVGLSYKTHGQATAVALGHELVQGGIKAERVGNWVSVIRSNPGRASVACWRGGLRSRTACEWILEAGEGAVRIEGGYKAIRQILLQPFLTDGWDESLPPLRVLSGMTGAGKTKLLLGLGRENVPVIDLEGHARHRGSSFGLRPGDRQPSQATFENSVGLDIYRLRAAGLEPIWVEDESRAIGRVVLPGSLKSGIESAGVILLEATLERRVSNIFNEYVETPLNGGLEPDFLREALLASVRGIERRLGGAMTLDCLRRIDQAFQERDFSPDRHRPWIENLLVHYYDKAYALATSRHGRKVLFQGEEPECRQWIRSG